MIKNIFYFRPHGKNSTLTKIFCLKFLYNFLFGVKWIKLVNFKFVSYLDYELQCFDRQTDIVSTLTGFRFTFKKDQR